jgi:hypothetical protein
LKNNTDPEEEIRKHLGAEDAEALWQLVKTNLQAGRIRMLFVADHIPAELRRIVEFLNKQMNRAEMLALELRQFVGEGLRTIVPTVYGQTEEAREGKSVPSIRGTISAKQAWITMWKRQLESATEAKKPQIKARIADAEAWIATATPGRS